MFILHMQFLLRCALKIKTLGFLVIIFIEKPKKLHIPNPTIPKSRVPLLDRCLSSDREAGG